MSLKERISDDMKAAMRARDQARLEAIRMLRAAIQRREVDDKITLDDEGVLAVIQKQVKQSQDAIEQFVAGKREDLADKERGNLTVLQAYLPEQLDDATIEELIDTAIGESGASGIRDMGKVMALLKPKLQGRADMGQVSARVKARLQG